MVSSTPEFTPESTRGTLLAACRAAELDAKDAELIRIGENALYHLAREGVVVRIARRMDYWETVCKEVHVAQWLSSHHVPAAELADVDLQPREVQGHPVTFWRFIPGAPARPADVRALGTTLRTVHNLPMPQDFKLPRVDIFSRVRPRVKDASIPDDDKAMLLGKCDELEAGIDALKFPLDPSPIHGDAHIKNIMIFDGNPIVIDFENFAFGQPEWDLSMTATEYLTANWWTADQYAQFVDSYGSDITSWSGFPLLRQTHEIKMTTWVMQNIDHSEQICREFESRMRTIRSGDLDAAWSPM